MDFYWLFNTNFLVILVLLSLPSLLAFFLKRRNLYPPGPIRLPFIGNLHQISSMPHHSFQRLSDKYGPLMFLQLGSIPTLVISSADITKEVFKNHDLVFSGRPVLYSARKFSYNCFDISFAPYGEYWREIRKIAILELLSAKKVQSFERVRNEEVALMIGSIASSNDTVNLSEILLQLANDILSRVAFGMKYSEKTHDSKNQFNEMLHDTQELLGGFALADFFPTLGWIHKFDGLEAKVERSFKQWDEFYDQVIDEHLDSKRPKPEVEDLVDVLLRVQGDPTQKISLNRDQIKGVITDMFIAGTDTSSATLVWAMTELIRNPTIMAKVQEEVRGVVGKKEMAEESDLPHLNYLKLVVKETMRLHPPAPLLVPRETTEKCTVLGYEIPAKTRVFINAKAIMTDPKIWENPQEFEPERFLHKDVDFKGGDCEFLPFGIGRRGCPGINFALVTVELVLANLLHHFNWELPQGEKRDDVDMSELFGLTMHKKTPLCLVAKR